MAPYKEAGWTKFHYSIFLRYIENYKWINEYKSLSDSEKFSYHPSTTNMPIYRQLFNKEKQHSYWWMVELKYNLGDILGVFQLCKCLASVINHTKIPVQYFLISKYGASVVEECCSQLWVWHMVCGQTCDGLYHFAFYLVNFGIPFGSHPIKSAQARHTGVQVPVVPAK